MIIGTAGHIDHGKSALVTALTGIAVDRLAEEKRRGITIDLNFAPLSFPGLPPAGIVDVPGHEDFVRTMIAGASGVDLVLLVVDAAQGPEPQTWEHLAIVEQLRIPLGIPVITKADLAEPEWLELVRTELAERLAASPVRFREPAVVSAVTGLGIQALLDRLRVEIETAGPGGQPAGDGFRMPVDRAFSLAGVGTVVTGTPWSGELLIGDPVRLLPSGKEGKVRSLEAYGASVEVARAGRRSAVGISGVERAAIRRGETLVCARLPWRATHALDAAIELLPGVAPLRRQQRVRVLLGTAEVLARVYPRQAGGSSGRSLARLALEAPMVARGRDRLVLRSYSPVTTIGGGEVLDPLPSRKVVWPDGLNGSLEDRLTALVARRNQATIEELPVLLGLAPAHSEGLVRSSRGIRSAGAVLITTEMFDRIAVQALHLVADFHRRNPGSPGISTETLRRSLPGPSEAVAAVLESLVAAGRISSRVGAAALPGFQPERAGTEELVGQLAQVFEAAGLEPPTTLELEDRLGRPGLALVLKQMVGDGLLVQVEQARFFSTKAVEAFVAAMRQLAANQPVTPAALRDHLGTTRKFLIPLLEWADRTGVTRRVGDGRVMASGSERGRTGV